jgi:myosin heavy subunit
LDKRNDQERRVYWSVGVVCSFSYPFYSIKDLADSCDSIALAHLVRQTTEPGKEILDLQKVMDETQLNDRARIVLRAAEINVVVKSTDISVGNEDAIFAAFAGIYITRFSGTRLIPIQHEIVENVEPEPDRDSDIELNTTRVHDIEPENKSRMQIELQEQRLELQKQKETIIELQTVVEELTRNSESLVKKCDTAKKNEGKAKSRYAESLKEIEELTKSTQSHEIEPENKSSMRKELQEQRSELKKQKETIIELQTVVEDLTKNSESLAKKCDKAKSNERKAKSRHADALKEIEELKSSLTAVIEAEADAPVITIPPMDHTLMATKDDEMAPGPSSSTAHLLNTKKKRQKKKKRILLSGGPESDLTCPNSNIDTTDPNTTTIPPPNTTANPIPNTATIPTMNTVTSNTLNAALTNQPQSHDIEPENKSSVQRELQDRLEFQEQKETIKALQNEVDLSKANSESLVKRCDSAKKNELMSKTRHADALKEIEELKSSLAAIIDAEAGAPVMPMETPLMSTTEDDGPSSRTAHILKGKKKRQTIQAEDSDITASSVEHIPMATTDDEMAPGPLSSTAHIFNTKKDMMKLSGGIESDLIDLREESKIIATDSNVASSSTTHTTTTFAQNITTSPIQNTTLTLAQNTPTILTPNTATRFGRAVNLSRSPLQSTRNFFNRTSRCINGSLYASLLQISTNPFRSFHNATAGLLGLRVRSEKCSDEGLDTVRRSTGGV